MGKLVVGLDYFPCIAYFHALKRHEVLLLDIDSYYEKQTYTNRCHIATSQGVDKLVVPIKHVGGKHAYKEVRIDYSSRWHVHHMRALQTAYGKAPYYEVMEELCFPVLSRTHGFLMDLSLELLMRIMRFFGIPQRVELTKGFIGKSEAMAEGDGDMVDMRGVFHPKRKLDESLIKELPVYRPIFEQPFVANLSVLDILCCEGGY